MVEDDSDLKDSVQRLHRFVVDALREARDDPFGSPVTVAEIYQELAPYRTVRTTLGFEMNADYEHALVRLLSGLDGLTRLDPPKAREALQRELESPNPDVTLYRHFAACDVVLNPVNPGVDWVREQLEEEEREEQARQERERQPPAPRSPDWGNLEDLVQDDVPAASPPPPPAPLKFAHADPAPPSCAHCDAELPEASTLRFCPFCGADQTARQCASCGEQLRAGWAFCIACGTPVA